MSVSEFPPVNRGMFTRLGFLSILCLGLATLCGQSFAQEANQKPFRFQVLPSGFYTPETNIGLGIIGLTYRRAPDSSTNSSNAQIFLDVTLNKQFQFQSDLNWFTRGNEYYIKWSHDISRFPEIFYGIGNESAVDDACAIDLNLYNANLKLFKRLRDRHYLGLHVHHQTIRNVHKPNSGIQVGALMDYGFSGIGIEALIDQRDYLLNPQNGKYIELGLTPYISHTDNRRYLQFVQDLRLYKTVGKDWVINTNLVGVETFGDVPFRMMPVIGGPRFLRGFYYGRFRDKNLLLGQLEVRKPIFWRVSMACFSGLGQVYSSLSDFSTDRFHHNYGVGLRFRIDEASQANIRIDYGRTMDSQGLYIVYGEAF